MIGLPKYITPSERGYQEYVCTVKQFNTAFQTRLRDSLGDVICSSGPHFGVFTTGSDGRLEKGPASKLEFVILNDGQLAEEQMSIVVYGLKNYRPSLTADDLDIRNLAADSMSMYCNQPSRTYPMRIMDLSYLAGNSNFGNISKIRLIQEWTGLNGKKILERVNNRKSEYKRITSTGQGTFKGTKLTHFDLDEGIANYLPDEGLLSFKVGPLRYLQVSITRDIIRYARSFPIPEGSRVLNLLRGMPSNTADRLLFLEAEDLLSINPREVSDLNDCYGYFLWLYHQSQEKLEHNGNESVLPFDKHEVKSRLESMGKIMERGILKIPI